MRDSLPIQAGLAPEFLAQAWPALLRQAREHLPRDGRAITRVVVCGCGDSRFAAQGAEFGMALWSGRMVRASPSMAAARYPLDRADQSLLVVGISSSGEVARTVEAIEVARRAGARTLAVTCTPSSSLSEAAEAALIASLPPHSFGPGLLSYLASLLGLFAVTAALSDADARRRIDSLIAGLPGQVAGAATGQSEQARAFAEQVRDAPQGVVLGSGPALGAAGFAAAKVLESCGLGYHAQEVEEWAHLEYFHATTDMPAWILTSDGRDSSRVEEVMHAARAVGRRLAITRWHGDPEWSCDEREALSPLGLWPGPVAFAQRLMELLGEDPFRAFGGGRDRAEGGGASRIRTSRRLTPSPRATTGTRLPLAGRGNAAIML